jgi:hypothetical protein
MEDVIQQLCKRKNEIVVMSMSPEKKLETYQTLITSIHLLLNPSLLASYQIIQFAYKLLARHVHQSPRSITFQFSLRIN